MLSKRRSNRTRRWPLGHSRCTGFFGSFHSLHCLLFEHIAKHCLLPIARLDYHLDTQHHCPCCLSSAMSAKPEIPDAWDDDWESQADVCEFHTRFHSVCHCNFFHALCKSHSDRQSYRTQQPGPPRHQKRKSLRRSPKRSAERNKRSSTDNYGPTRMPLAHNI